MTRQNDVTTRVEQGVSFSEANPHWPSVAISRFQLFGRALATKSALPAHSEESVAAWIAEVHNLNQSMGFPVKVSGNIGSLDMKDWMTIEQELVSQWWQLNTVVRPDSYVKQALSARPLTLPFQLNNRNIQRHTRQSIGLLGSMLSVLGASSCVTSSMSTALIILGLGVLSSLGASFQYAAWSHHCEQELAKAIMAELSPTWQDVFQHKTAVDSLLVGMIAQLTYILSRNPQQNVLPNLLAINPATAFECISKVYSDDGGLNSDSLLLMSLIAKRCATQPHVVAGIDVSGMIDTESPELVTLPHAGRYH